MLLLLDVVSRLFFLLLLHCASSLPLFDASPLLLTCTSLLAPLLRWDVFHLVHIAQEDYLFEHEWAFFPALPFALRSFSFLFTTSTTSLSLFLLSGLLAASACQSTRLLYQLSLHHLRSPKLARVATLLSLLPTSPVTLYFAPYNEPLFTHFSYRGMLYCAQQKWLLAAVSFALAGALRSNGIFLVGFILWGLFIPPFLNGKMPKPSTVFKSIFLTAIVISPFVTHHIVAYSIFCNRPTPIPPWCSRFPPSIYTYVQSKYWNSGFLQYWSISQIPNFLIAAPTVVLISSFAVHHLCNTTLFGPPPPNPESAKTLNLSFQAPSITPHVLHAMFFTIILVFASHTQIILRLAASMPVVYWAACWLLVQHPFMGRLWVTWSVLWSLISTILWATFLPPA